MVDNARILELQRRVRSDPAPFVFAQLAEEYRRSGRFSDAVACCREGLSRHPGYLSGRLILGRSLAALTRWDEAVSEYEQVVMHSPDNLAATRELADICERQGRTSDALTYYRRALALARNDRALEAAIQRLSAGGDASPEARTAVQEPPPSPAPKVSARQVDFDAVLALLGRPHQQPPPLTERLLSDPMALLPAATAVSAAPPIPTHGDDALATIEKQLREYFDPLHAFPAEEAPQAAGSTSLSDAARIDAAVIAALEAWLDVIARDRHQMRQL